LNIFGKNTLLVGGMVLILPSHAINKFSLQGFALGVISALSRTAATQDPPEIGKSTLDSSSKKIVELEKQLAMCVGHAAREAAVQKIPCATNKDSSAEK